MKESDIRPLDLFNRYLELAARDVETFFPDRAGFEPVPCPGCAADRSTPALTKLGFDYRRCDECGSLFVSPRPSTTQVERFYQEGESVEFWATDFFARTAEARRERIFRPRAALLREIVSANGGGGALRFVDIGSGYGIFLEEVAALGLFDDVLGVEPSPALAAVSREKGFTVLEEVAERLKPGTIGATHATAFEVLEHLWDPAAFLQGVANALVPGGRLLFTTLTVTGFDIQVLWERSKSVHPPHHLNLLSVEGMRRLIERSGFELEDLSTPGVLDVDIVRNALAEDPGIPVSRFERFIAAEAPERTRAEFQAFLQANALSSHIRVVARRPDGAR